MASLTGTYLILWTYLVLCPVTPIHAFIMKNVSFVRETYFDDSLDVTNIIRSNVSANSTVACLGLCSSTDDCQAIFYHPVNRTCYLQEFLVDQEPSSLQQEPGTRYLHLSPVPCEGYPGHGVYQYSGGVMCLWFNSIPLNQAEARAVCRRKGGDLVVASNSDKFYEVYKNFAAGWWAGAEKQGGMFYWYDGFPLVGIPNYAELYLTNSGDCIHTASSGKSKIWDADCMALRTSICEFP